MGQILNRIKNIAKAELSNDDAVDLDSFINSDEAELKRIINELNRQQNHYDSARPKDKNNSYSPSNKGFSSADAFRILEIPVSASIDEIKSAYKKRMLEYHPDKVASLGKEIKQLAEIKAQEINKAYQFLRKIKGF